MANSNNNQNMNTNLEISDFPGFPEVPVVDGFPNFPHFYPGFPEVPADAFTFLDDIPADPPVLRRYYRAHCPHCGKRISSTDANIRLITCNECLESACTTIARFFRGMRARKRFRKLRQKESTHRWLNSHDINGIELSRKIMEFL